MTEQEYKELQSWCKVSSNKKSNPDLYAKKVELRNKATEIRRKIHGYREAIKGSMFALEASKKEDAIKKWIRIVNENKAYKAILLEQFKNLEAI